MATLKIYEGPGKIKDSATPQTSTLALPLSLATNRGKAISSVGKVIGKIQKDLHKIEDENEYAAIMPSIITDISKKYTELSKTSDIINGPKELEKTLNYKNYSSQLKGANKNVQRLVRQELNNQTISLMPKLVGNISQNVVDKALVNIDLKFNQALLNATSEDAALIAAGSVQFDLIKNNKAYEALVGPKEWKAYIDKKSLQLAEIQINKQINLNPTSLIKNKKSLIDMVGTDKAEEYLEKAKVSLLSKTNEEEKNDVLQEALDNETKMGLFVELVERVNQNKEGEVPTIANLYDALENNLINQVMFNQLVGMVSGEEKLSDEQLHETITVALYSADSIGKMDDIKKAVLLDPNVLRALDLKDVTLFTKIIDRAKKDFPAHKDFKTFGKLLDANMKNLSNIRSGKMLKYAQAIETRKVLIKDAYMQKVVDGMSPQNSYLSVLANEMDINAIPQLSNVAPGFLKNVKFKEAFAKDPNFFETQNKVIWERYNGVSDSSKPGGEKIKGHGSIKKMQQELAQLDFMEKLYNARLAVAVGEDLATKQNWALEGGLGYSPILERIKEGK